MPHVQGYDLQFNHIIEHGYALESLHKASPSAEDLSRPPVRNMRHEDLNNMLDIVVPFVSISGWWVS